jgi:hypothetical protein
LHLLSRHRLVTAVSRPGETISEAIMAHKKQHTGRIPPGNRPHAGPQDTAEQPGPKGEAEVASDQEQDPKRRLGDFAGKGEHLIQELGGKNDANR